MNERKTTPAIRGTTPAIEQRARELRLQMTSAERQLWEALKGKQLEGLRFRAQHPVGRFILDFYCPAQKLVVEVDGKVHDTTQERDEERAAYLTAFGYHVVRVRNDEIETDLSAVLERIRQSAHLHQNINKDIL